MMPSAHVASPVTPVTTGDSQLMSLLCLYLPATRYYTVFFFVADIQTHTKPEQGKDLTGYLPGKHAGLRQTGTEVSRLYAWRDEAMTGNSRMQVLTVGWQTDKPMDCLAG